MYPIERRLPSGEVDLEEISRFDGVAMAKLLASGVELLLVERKDDPVFREKVRDTYGQAATILTGVAGAEGMLEVVNDMRSRHFDEPPIDATQI